jgi:hypothetical protein
MSNRFALGGSRESTDGMLVWSVSVDDDDDEADEDADFEDDDEPSIRRLEIWSSRPDFGSPEWWSRT